MVVGAVYGRALSQVEDQGAVIDRVYNCPHLSSEPASVSVVQFGNPLGGSMKRYLGWLLVLTCGGLLQQPAAAQSVDPVQRALEDEVKRAGRQWLKQCLK